MEEVPFDRAGFVSALNIGLESFFSKRGDGTASVGDHLQYLTEAFKRQELVDDGWFSSESIRSILTPVYFAGVGSTGFAAINGIARNIGSMFAYVADIDRYSLSNLPRQMLTASDIDKEKAETTATWYKGLLPYSYVDFSNNGVNEEDISHQLAELGEYCEAVNQILGSYGLEGINPIIFDSVDVTTTEGWEARFVLHQAASERGIHVIAAFDIGRSSLVFDFPYEQEEMLPFKGAVTRNMLHEGKTPQDLNMAMLPKIVGPIPKVPFTYARQYIERAGQIIAISELNRTRKGQVPFPGMPQERIASTLYEALVSSRLRRVVHGENIKPVEYFQLERESWLDSLKTALLFIANRGLIREAGVLESQGS